MKDVRKKIYATLTSTVLRYTTEFFQDKEFIQLMPVILSPITDPLGPDPGSTVIKTGEIEYLGQMLTLTQSMILHKQLAVREGLEKIFIISPNIRLEHPKRRESKKHLFEFSQVDFEIAYAKQEDVFKLMEEFIIGLTVHMHSRYAHELGLLGRTLQPISGPFPRYSTHELEKIYGKDWEIPASVDASKPFWALCHKREFYDKEDSHEPGHYLNYDLIYPEGFGEGLSGAEREHEYETIVKKIGHHQLDKSKYEPYLEIAELGLTPSAGGGFGVERLVRWITGANHVGDVQLFRRVPGEPITV